MPPSAPASEDPRPSQPAASPPAVEPPPAGESGAPRDELLALLRGGGGGAGRERISELVQHLEREHPADLRRDLALVEGVWELRWSSSSLPYLATAPWLTNLQVLAPSRGQGMNLLRLAGPLGELAGITVRAAIAVEPPTAPDQPNQRVSVRFERGGWLGPRLGGQRLRLLREVRQSFPAWLDITVVDGELRICRGNAGTVFALLRRPDLSLEELLASSG